MVMKNFIGISGFKYATKPKMGTSNVFNGIFLDAYGEKKIAKAHKKEQAKMKGSQKMAKAKKAKSSAPAPKLNSNFMYGTMPNASAPKKTSKGKKK